MKFLSNLLLCAALSSPTLVAGVDWLIVRDSLALTGANSDVVTGTFSVTAPADSSFTYELLDFDGTSCSTAVSATGLTASAAPAAITASATAATFTVDATVVSAGLSTSSFFDSGTSTITACMRIEITNIGFGEVMNRIDAPFSAAVTVSGTFASVAALSLASGAITSQAIAGGIATTAVVNADRVLNTGDVAGQIQAGSPLEVAVSASDGAAFTVTDLFTLELVRDKGVTATEFVFPAIVSGGANQAAWDNVASVACATGTCTVIVNLPFSFFEVAGTTATLEGLANLVVNRRVLTEDGRELEEATRELGEFTMTLDAKVDDASSTSGLAAAGAITASIVFTLLA